MRVPAAPSVGLQTGQSPDYVANPVAPMGNPNADVMEKAGEGLFGVGQTIMRVDDILQERLERTHAKEADAKIADGYRTLLTSPGGYRTKIGRDAITGREDTIKALDAHRAQILGSLTPREREMLMESDTARYQHAREAIDGHYVEQLGNYEIGESESRANQLMLDSVEGYFAPKSPLDAFSQDPMGPLTTQQQEAQKARQDKRNAYEANRTAMLHELQELATRKGLGPGATKSLLQKADDNLHTGIVSRLVDQGKAKEAKDYLDTQDMLGRVSATTMTKLSDGLELASAKETATNTAQELSAIPGGLPAQLAELEKRYSAKTWGKYNDAVFKDAMGQLTQHDKLTSEELKRQQEIAWPLIEQNLRETGGVLDAKYAQLVKDTQLVDKANLFIARGQQWITTDVGHYALTVMTPRELREKFPTEAVLRYNYRFETTTQDLDALTARWKSYEEKFPKPDKKITYADGLRDSLGLPKTGKRAELDKNLSDRWDSAVDVEVAKLMRAKPGSTEEEQWGAAMDNVRKQGFYLSPSGTGNPRMFIQAEPGEMSGSVFIKRGNEMVEARLDDLFPPTGKTYRETAQMKFEAESLTEEPGKPKGYVMIDGKAVKFSAINLSDVVREATDIHEGYNRQQLIESRRVGQQWLQDAYQHEFRNVAGSRTVPQLEGENTVETLPVAPKDLPDVKMRARAAVLRRESEWRGFHLTQQEIDAIIGPPPPTPIPMPLRVPGL